MPPPEPRSRTTSPGSSAARAVGWPQPSEAATTSAGSDAVSPDVYRLAVMGSHPLREVPGSQHEPARSAALAYFSFTIRLISCSAMSGSEVCSAAGREETHQRRHRVPPHAVEDVPRVLAALHQARPAQQLEVVGQRGTRYLHRALDLARRALAPGAHQEEEHAQAPRVPQRLEGLGVRGAGFQVRVRGLALHISIYIQLSNECQPAPPQPRRARRASAAAAGAGWGGAGGPPRAGPGGAPV